MLNRRDILKLAISTPFADLTKVIKPIYDAQMAEFLKFVGRTDLSPYILSYNTQIIGSHPLLFIKYENHSDAYHAQKFPQVFNIYDFIKTELILIHSCYRIYNNCKYNLATVDYDDNSHFIMTSYNE